MRGVCAKKSRKAGKSRGLDWEGFFGEGEGAGAVGKGVFDFGGELGEGLVVAGGDEEGVVAEAVGAAGGVGEGAFAGAENGAGLAVGRGEGEDATEAGGAVGDALHGGDELLEVVGVGGAFAGVARGTDAGGAVEVVDFEAGVVGERPEPGDEGKGAGFEDGVAFKGVGGFLDFGEIGEVVGGENFNAEHGANFGEFVGVTGGEEEFHGFDF